MDVILLKKYCEVLCVSKKELIKNDIDWREIQKDYEKLGCPPYTFNPLATHDMLWSKWILDISERSTGKTTNWLLVAMLIYWRYGFDTAYIRQEKRMITKTNAGKLFNTIIDCGYIETITGGRYNTIKTEFREHYFYSTETDERDEHPFMTSICLEEDELNKSNLNMPNCHLILYDEFMRIQSTSQEFITFCNTLKTIIRSREQVNIILLGNTLDRHNVYFKELGIYECMQSLLPNETLKKQVVNVKYQIRWIDQLTTSNELANIRQRHNNMFFGFGNKRLNSILGGDWQINNYPHLPHASELGELYLICQNRFILHNDKILQLMLYYSSEIGMFVKVCPFTSELKDDYIAYTLDVPKCKNVKFKWGIYKLDKVMYDLYIGNRFYFATNAEGSLFESYMHEAKNKILYQ